LLGKTGQLEMRPPGNAPIQVGRRGLIGDAQNCMRTAGNLSAVYKE
jgi:hypothetical protein